MSKKINLNIGDKNRPNLLSLFRNYIIRKLEEDKKKWSDYRRKHPCPSYLGFDDYTDEEYYEEMECLRSYYGYENMANYYDDDDDDDDDYIVTSDGVIIFPEGNNKRKGSEDTYNGLRPGEYHRSAKDMDEYWDKMSKFNSKGKHKHRKHKAKVIDIEKPYNAQYINNDDDENDFSSHIIYFYEDYKDKYSKIEFNSVFEFDKYCEEMGFTVPPYIGEMLSYCNISHCCLNPLAKDRGILEVMREETYGDLYYEACESSYNYDEY